MTTAGPEAWATDDDLRSARERFIAGIPGFAMPEACAVARVDAGVLTYGHVNRPGEVRPLPTAVLASVCGYVATTAVFRLDRDRFAEVVDRLAPAEAATHVRHPNLWSWRDLLTGAAPDSTFLVFFVASTDDPPVDEDDARFRRLLAA
ncbi:hypothetical protein [Saccharothrix xinjiangensis]|uniref:Uncharacterized protein n=1 Tax=Saccharothrix xinjiangensis TaxID=204798 RepID=A0ABV9Y917_9PSEU